MVDLSQSVSKGFYEMATQFLDSSVAAWPEDPMLPLACIKLKSMDPDDALLQFQTTFEDHLENLAKRDEETLFKIGDLDDFKILQIREKFLSSNATTRDTVWTYIGHLCRFAGMKSLYKFIPTNVLETVTQAAQQLKRDIDSGAIDTKDINPYDLGQKVMSQFQPEEIEQMMKSITSDPKAMSLMMTQMAGSMGTNGPNMESMMKMFPKLE
jgi:hypothetical protein